MQDAAAALGGPRALEDVERVARRAHRVDGQDVRGLRVARAGGRVADELEGVELGAVGRRVARRRVEPDLAHPADARQQLAEGVGVASVSDPPRVEAGRERHVLLASQRVSEAQVLGRGHRDGQHAGAEPRRALGHLSRLGEPPQVHVHVIELMPAHGPPSVRPA